MSTYHKSNQPKRTASGNATSRLMESVINRLFNFNLSEVNVDQSELDEDLRWGQK